MKNSVFLRFDDTDSVVELVNSYELIGEFQKIFKTWKFGIQNICEDDFPSRIIVRQSIGGYCIETPRLEKPYTRSHAVDAICGLIIEVVWSYIAKYPDRLCLHGAAGKFGNKLVVFPSTYRAGKSVLSACLASSGIQLFSDDILPVVVEKSRYYGTANGILPRLRLPLPLDKLSQEDQAFISANCAAKSDHYYYLDLKSSELATRGTQCAIGAFVLLDRRAGESAQLHPVATGEMLKAVVWQNFARQMKSADILNHFRMLVENTLKFRLIYDHPHEAIEILMKQLSDNDGLSDTDHRLLETAAPNNSQLKYFAEDRNSEWLQKTPDVIEQLIDGQSFLCSGNGQSIHHLDTLASAIWKLMSEPFKTDEMLKLLNEAFPNVPKTQLNQDLCKLIDTLESKSLIRRVCPSEDCRV